MKFVVILFLCFSFHSIHSQCTVPTNLTLTDNFGTLTAGDNVTVSWTSDCPDALMTLSLLRIDPPPFSVAQQVTGIANNGSYSFTINSSNVPGTYQFYIQDSGTNIWTYGPTFILNAIVPVTWSKATNAFLDRENAIVTFSTAQQMNNDYFEVEHSANGRSFQAIGTIDGEGNTTKEEHYSFIHKNPANDQNYYRVKQVDNDGQYSYSNTAFLLYSDNKVSIYPNPAIDQISVNSLNTSHLKIYNHQGVEIGVFQLNEGPNKLDVSNFSSGIYMLLFEDGQVKRMIKN